MRHGADENGEGKGMNRVKADSWYRYEPVGIDCWDSKALVEAGSRVQVKALPGCPPPNTMGHCHIVNEQGQFAGLVLCNSLVK